MSLCSCLQKEKCLQPITEHFSTLPRVKMFSFYNDEIKKTANLPLLSGKSIADSLPVDLDRVAKSGLWLEELFPPKFCPINVATCHMFKPILNKIKSSA